MGSGCSCDEIAAVAAHRRERLERIVDVLHGDDLQPSVADGGASVVNIVSMAAFRSVPIVPGYGAAKSALVSLTRDLARQWVGDAIRVNAVAPGVIDTPMTAPLAVRPELRDVEIAHTPMGRFGTPAEVASTVLFRASSAATSP